MHSKLSIIIPVLNEANGLGDLLDFLNSCTEKSLIQEILVVDGGSKDDTIKIAASKNAIVVTSKKGRAKQMNHGAQQAKGEVLYFLHADTYPPKDFEKHIINAVTNGFEAGCFRMQFDSQNPVLKFFAYLSRINHSLCRGGDQSLFVTKEAFKRNKGFDEHYLIYEDTEFIRRLYSNLRFKILPYHVITSARKFREKGWYKVLFHFGVIHLKSYLGSNPTELHRYYQKYVLP